MFQLLILILLSLTVDAKQAFVFLGPTGDNAYRDNGVWQGLFEAFCGGIFEQADGVEIFAAMNTPHTEAELSTNILQTIEPLYKDLHQIGSWTCEAIGGDCQPQTFLSSISVNIHDGRNACAQAADMTNSLNGYDNIAVYMSIPPSAYGDWATCTVQHWGADRVHVAAEKPFGTSLENAQDLYKSITKAGLTDDSIHLVDHWLSFFMVRHMSTFRGIVGNALGINWDNDTFERAVIIQNEERGLQGRGAFFDGVGQTRDMIQSHLLQVLASTLVSWGCWTPAEGKKHVLDNTELLSCRHGQYDGFLLEPGLSFHGSFADATFTDATLAVNTLGWEGVPVTVSTGKDMDELLYTVTLYQRNGTGVLTFNIGKEEVGTANIKVSNWPLKDDSSFQAPAGGFNASATFLTKPRVANGSGYILEYVDKDMYFPKAYSTMVSALLLRDYRYAFVTFPECLRSWEIVTQKAMSVCLDPLPEDVRVYAPPTSTPTPTPTPTPTSAEEACTTIAPDKVCWESISVLSLYDDTFKCTSENDIKYENVSFYQAKCNPSSYV